MIDWSKIVGVTELVKQEGLKEQNLSDLALFTTEPKPESYKEDFKKYLNSAEVAEDFGTDSLPVKMAAKVFAQTPNIKAGNGSLIIIPMKEGKSKSDMISEMQNKVNFFGIMFDDIGFVKSADFEKVAKMMQDNAMNKVLFAVSNDITVAETKMDGEIELKGAFVQIAGTKNSKTRCLFYNGRDEINAAIVKANAAEEAEKKVVAEEAEALEKIVEKAEDADSEDQGLASAVSTAKAAIKTLKDEKLNVTETAKTAASAVKTAVETAAKVEATKVATKTRAAATAVEGISADTELTGAASEAITAAITVENILAGIELANIVEKAKEAAKAARTVADAAKALAEAANATETVKTAANKAEAAAEAAETAAKAMADAAVEVKKVAEAAAKVNKAVDATAAAKLAILTTEKEVPLGFMAAYAGRGLATNFNGYGTAFTMQLKTLNGISPDTTIANTEYDKLMAAGVDCYPSFGIAKVATSGVNEFFDVVVYKMAIKASYITSLFNSLATTPTKVAQTNAGLGQIMANAIRDLKKFQNSGVLASGVNWSSEIPIPVSDDIFQLGIFQNGMYLWFDDINKQQPSEREERKTPPGFLAIKFAGAFHGIETTITFEN